MYKLFSTTLNTGGQVIDLVIIFVNAAIFLVVDADQSEQKVHLFVSCVLWQ